MNNLLVNFLNIIAWIMGCVCSTLFIFCIFIIWWETNTNSGKLYVMQEKRNGRETNYPLITKLFIIMAICWAWVIAVKITH